MKDKYKLKDKGLGDLVREAINLGDKLPIPGFEDKYSALIEELNKRGAKYERAAFITKDSPYIPRK